MFCYFIPLGFPSTIKRLTLDILKFIVTTLMNQNKKVALILLDQDVAQKIYSGFLNTGDNMKSIVQTIGGYASSINEKSEIPNKILANFTRTLLPK